MRPIQLTLFLSLALGIGGCKSLPFLRPKPTPSPTPRPAPKPPAIDYAALKPNELGRIPIVMYHHIGKDPKDTKLSRTVASFNRDLDLMYKHGWYPVNLSALLDDKIEVPAGKKPIVLTFDDAWVSQFKLIDKGANLQVDPNCAVGLIEAFCKSHSDWKPRATFFCLPPSSFKKDTFDQPGLGGQKLKYLADNGFEIGNHSTVHGSFAKYDAARVQKELGGAHAALAGLEPGVKIRTVALPFGVYPRNKAIWPYLLKGTYNGTSYRYDAALLAAWQPNPSPSSKDYKPIQLQRISPEDIVNGLANWLKRLDRVSPYAAYVSDGDPNCISFPVEEKGKLNAAKVKAEGKLVNAYDPSQAIASVSSSPAVGATPAPTKPIVGM